VIHLPLFPQANIVILAFAGGGGFISLPEKVILFVLLALLIIVSLWGYVAVSKPLCQGVTVPEIFQFEIYFE